MTFFRTKREKKLWIYVLILVVAIYATLGVAQRLAGLLRERGLITDLFWLAIFLVLIVIIGYGLKTKPGIYELLVWTGLAAAYLLVFLRMNSPEERSHMIEYSILAIFILEALRERAGPNKKAVSIALRAVLITALIGIVDELLQLFIPSRVFDPVDIGFNTLAACFAVGGSSLLQWLRGLKLSKNRAGRK